MAKKQSFNFAKSAMINAIKQAVKSGKNPQTGRRYTKKQISELKSLLKCGALK
jgi:hypothetical protein